MYDEDFTFYGLSMAEVQAISLHFVVLSFDRYSRDDVIGEVILPLTEVDLNQVESESLAFCKEIQPRSLKVWTHIVCTHAFAIYNVKSFNQMYFGQMVFCFRFELRVAVNYWYHCAGNQALHVLQLYYSKHGIYHAWMLPVWLIHMLKSICYATDNVLPRRRHTSRNAH